MNKIWKKNGDDFLELTTKHGVRILMVGGGAVNFYGCQRHSAEVDFWIETKETNLNKLGKALREMGFDVDDFPDSVKKQQQNNCYKIFSR